MASSSYSSSLSTQDSVAHRYIDNSEKLFACLSQNSPSNKTTHMSTEHYHLVYRFHEELKKKQDEIEKKEYLSLSPSIVLIFYFMSSVYTYAKILSNKEYARQLYTSVEQGDSTLLAVFERITPNCFVEINNLIK